MAVVSIRLGEEGVKRFNLGFLGGFKEFVGNKLNIGSAMVMEIA